MLLIHFEGFPHKWDEWIHSACFISSANSCDALHPSLRPRLAPLHTMTTPAAQPAPLSSSRRSHFRVGEAVSVSVHIPLSELDSPPARGSSRGFVPQFEQLWFQAIVVAVEHDQLHIRYEPPQESDDHFSFPVWFSTRLNEVKRFGPAQTADGSSSAAAVRNGATAAAAAGGRVQAQAVPANQRESHFSPVAALTDKIKGLWSPFSADSNPTAPLSLSPTVSAASDVSPLASDASASAAAAAAVFPSVVASPAAAAVAPYSSTVSAARTSISRPTPAVQPVRTALSPSPQQSRTNVAVSPPPSSFRRETPTPVPAAAPSPSVDYAPLLRASQTAPLRAAVGMINMGNTCYISAGLQCLAGLLPLIQYFVVERQYEGVIRQRLKTTPRQTVPPSLYRPVPPLKPGMLPYNFGELTREFAAVMQASVEPFFFSSFSSVFFQRACAIVVAGVDVVPVHERGCSFVCFCLSLRHHLCVASLSLHSGDEARIYPDQLKRLVVGLPNDAGARFRGVHMQDAHEFLSVLLNALQNELNTAPPMPHAAAANGGQGKGDGEKSAPFDPAAAARTHWRDFQLRNTDVLSHLFYCQAAQYVICSSCQHPSCNHHVMGQLTLDIPHVPARQKRPPPPATLSPSARMPSTLDGDASEWEDVTLEQCLATQLVADRLDDYFCSRCQRKNPAITSSYFTSLPPLLLIQLKRFDALSAALSGRLSADSKDSTHCIYPLELDLSALLQPHSSVSSLPISPYTLSSRSVAPYRLVGLVRHHDDHYTAFSRVRDPATGRAAWGYFNDSRTFIETDDDALGHTHTVYLLVYQRRDDHDA